jgi:hypothetical protein
MLRLRWCHYPSLHPVGTGAGARSKGQQGRSLAETRKHRGAGLLFDDGLSTCAVRTRHINKTSGARPFQRGGKRIRRNQVPAIAVLDCGCAASSPHHPARPHPSIRAKGRFGRLAGPCLRHPGEKARIVRQPVIEEPGVAASGSPISRSKTKFGEPPLGLGEVHLPSGALSGQHSRRNEIVQGSLLRISGLASG